MMDRDGLRYFITLARTVDARVPATRAAAIAQSHMEALDRIAELESQDTRVALDTTVREV